MSYFKKTYSLENTIVLKNNSIIFKDLYIIFDWRNNEQITISLHSV